MKKIISLILVFLLSSAWAANIPQPSGNFGDNGGTSASSSPQSQTYPPGTKFRIIKVKGEDQVQYRLPGENIWRDLEFASDIEVRMIPSHWNKKGKVIGYDILISNKKTGEMIYKFTDIKVVNIHLTRHLTVVGLTITVTTAIVWAFMAAIAHG